MRTTSNQEPNSQAPAICPAASAPVLEVRLSMNNKDKCFQTQNYAKALNLLRSGLGVALALCVCENSATHLF